MDRINKKIALIVPNRTHRLLNFPQDTPHVSVGHIPAHSGLHETATFYAENNNQFSAQLVHCVFNPSQGMVVYDVARGADHEQISKVLVKKNLRRGP